MAYRPLTDAEVHRIAATIEAGHEARRRLYDLMLRLHSDGVTSDELAAEMGVSRSTYYRLMLEIGAEQR